MKDWKHLTFEQRKVISNGISHNYKLKEIAETLGFDPTSISKEVKRNRESITIGLNVTNCKKVTRWPYVCTGCNKRYNNQCCFTKYKYDAKKAQNKADTNLINSRKGIDIDPDKFQRIDKIVKDVTDNKKSIYQITIENKEEIDKSVTTIYRYINNGYLTTKKFDLPYAVKLKKRKHNKQLRLYFPKGKTIDTYVKKDIKDINWILLNKPLKSLDSYTPKQAFVNVFDEDLFNKIL